MVEVVSLSDGSAGLASNVADASPAPGILFVLDCAAGPPADPWESWVVKPTQQVLSRLSADAQREVLRAPVVGLARTATPSGGAPWGRDAFEMAAVEALRGILGAVALEVTGAGARANLVVADEAASLADIRTSVRYLFDERAAGFTTGATLRLAGMRRAVHPDDGTAATGGKQAADVRPRALVMGAAGGIGFATAKALIAAGYAVVMADANRDRVQSAAAQLGAASLVCDVTDREGLRRTARSELPADGLQVLAIHHGIEGSGALRSLDERRIERTIAINATGVLAAIEEFLPVLKRGAPSTIVALSSQAGLKAEPNNSAYCATKFAVVGLVQGLAPRLASDLVRLHALCPGPTDTPLMADAFALMARGSGQDAESYRRQRLAAIPLGRAASPDEMAAATLYLCQLESCTGVILAPTGGETLT